MRNRIGQWCLVACVLVAGLLGLSTFHGDQPATPLATAPAAHDQGLVTKPIDEIRLGDRVLGLNPQLDESQRSTPDPDPATWRTLSLTMTNGFGQPVDIQLLRPQSWLDAQDARPGQSIWLDLPELGAVGTAQVQSIGPCPQIQPGPGRVVTGTFTHESHARMLDVYLEGTDRPITCTANHAFWSETVQDFTPAEGLRPRDRVRTATGSTLSIARITQHPGPHPLHNLEVHLEHVYQVSPQGVLVHNASAPEPPAPDVKYHYTDAPDESFQKGLWADSSVTDNPNLTPQQAVEQLGVKRPPDKIIPVRDRGNFVPNRPPIVDPHRLGPGGGRDFTNPKPVPPHDILPAIPITKGGS